MLKNRPYRICRETNWISRKGAKETSSRLCAFAWEIHGSPWRTKKPSSTASKHLRDTLFAKWCPI